MPPSTNFDPSQIPIVQIVFGIMTLCTIGGGLGVVSSRNLFHSALYLVVSFFGVAGYYVLLSAGFLAVVQLMVYIGAVAILIMFAIMLSRQMMGHGEDQTNHQSVVSAFAALLLFAALFFVINAVHWPGAGPEPTTNAVQELGLAFLGSYLLPFEVVGILLSVALIGSIILAREKTEVEEA